jgi:hypothetical protein cdivTM_08453
MNIKEILLKPVSELTMDEQEQAAKFLKGAYQDLLEMVDGHTKNEKDKTILALSFEQKIDLVIEYRNGRDN